MPSKQIRGVGEWLAVIGILCTLLSIFIGDRFPTFKPVLGQIGLAGFFAGVLVSIKEIKDKTQEAEKTLSLISESFDSVQKFGPAVNAVTGVVDRTTTESQNSARTAHVLASGHVLKHHMTEELPSLAQCLVGLRSGRAKLYLPEPYFVSAFLSEFQGLLPKGCVWCAITRLTRGWVENNEEPGFHQFAEDQRVRSMNSGISVFRIYDPVSEPIVKGFREHIDRELASKISVKILDYGESRPDISLIWQPFNVPEHASLEFKRDPIKTLSSAKVPPVCALRFETSFGSRFHSVSIVPPDSREFSQLADVFSVAWERARVVVSPSSDAGAHVSPNGVNRRVDNSGLH